MTWETYRPLAALAGVTHAFSLRGPADTRQADSPARFVAAHGFAATQFAAAEQTHGNAVAVVTGPAPAGVPAVDGVITATPGLPLVIRCADCAAVFLVDRARRAIALLHSGRAGTRGNIVGAALAALRREFGVEPRDCLALISPSIGPCHYEIDLWTAIEAQLRAGGVGEIENPRTCTACQLGRYYSYRAEQGKTGRMFALLALNAA